MVGCATTVSCPVPAIRSVRKNALVDCFRTHNHCVRLEPPSAVGPIFSLTATDGTAQTSGRKANMARWIPRTCIVLGIWLGLAGARVLAQPPNTLPLLPSPVPPVTYHAIPSGEAAGMSLEPPLAPVAEGEVQRGPIRRFLYKVTHPFCWTTHNHFGCSSLHSEATFAFGSCRAFFGQACLKGPPADDVPGSSCGCGSP